jgi:small subunit ribosomal protein S6
MAKGRKIGLNKYETIIIINPNIEADAIESIIQNVQNLISENNCQITKLDKWGKRRLAYEVKGNKEGYYVLIDYTSESQFIQRLSQYCSLAENIIKYMTVRADKLPEVKREPIKIDEGRYRRPRDDDDDEFGFDEDFDDYEDDYDQDRD